MTGPHGDQIVEGYLARLRNALADLPRPRQDELLNDVKGHIAEARAGSHDETDADVLNILDRIGEPADIAAEARERLGVQARQPDRIGLLEIGALVLTPIFWPVGVILLWTSSAWTTRDKLIGTLIPPGGYMSISFLLLGGPGSYTSSSTCAQTGTGPMTCTYQGPPGWLTTIGTVVGIFILVLPILTAIYLGVRLRQRTPARPAVPA